MRRRLGLLEGSISALTEGERRLPPHVERGVRGPQVWCGPRGPACWGRLAARANHVTEMELFPGSEGGQNGTRDQWRVRPRLRVAPSCQQGAGAERLGRVVRTPASGRAVQPLGARGSHLPGAVELVRGFAPRPPRGVQIRASVSGRRGGIAGVSRYQWGQRSPEERGTLGGWQRGPLPAPSPPHQAGERGTRPQVTHAHSHTHAQNHTQVHTRA